MAQTNYSKPGEHPETVSVGGMAYNLFWVTLGNTVSGALFMGIGITLAATRQTKKLAMLLVGMVRNQLQNQKK